ncbi:uncharacterized protein PAC_13839 [Phialocephala subalpina]|uniref:Uncharacterized protein n=1 Tax=Phialocephala subalpina TaxID=576137 RepID=A0A1L7XFZ1_9HELO|nr:uncharacterized protein PAC_13839 [Phialocephala subalpina]
MAASTPDLTLFNELYEEIESNPPALEARKLLTRQCYEVGWIDAARDALQELRAFDPSALEDEAWAKTLLEPPAKKAIAKKPKKPIPKPPSSPAELEAQKLELIRGYEELRSRAKQMLREGHLLRDLTKSTANNGSEAGSRFEVHDQDLQALINGRVHSVLRVRQPAPARGIARKIKQCPEKAVDIAVSDLESVARWLRSHSSGNNDVVREALVKRAQAITTVLPDAMKNLASTALMHVEHEVLRRKYVCEETMYGDQVSDIPRGHFLVTEDGYPWDMEELVQAIQSNGGVMRNPLSKQMFTIDDVRAIVHHPLGHCLAALQIEQSKLSQGIRNKTIDELDNMAKVLLADMSEDQAKSRDILDAFMAYVATLPETEQVALDKLRVPAVDSHTGIPFDTSVGEAVRDAQGNKLCFHKAADLLSQAASHLRKSR